MTRTALYRHFDAAGVLLYVGISLSAVQRLAQHKQTADWFAQIARVDVEWHPTRRDAEQAERDAIRAENPRCNSVRYGAVASTAPVEPRAWAILHPRSLRLDGWYRNRPDAVHLLGWFRAMFPKDRFELVGPMVGGDNYIHRSKELKWMDHALWAAGPPDCAAGDAYDKESAA